MRLKRIGWQRSEMEALTTNVPLEELTSPRLPGLPDDGLSSLLMGLRRKFAGKICCICLHHVSWTISRFGDCRGLCGCIGGSTSIAAGASETAQLLRQQQMRQTQMQEHLQRLELRTRHRPGSTSAASVGRAIEATVKPQDISDVVSDLRLPTDGEMDSFLEALGRFAEAQQLPAGYEWVDI